jgi:protein-S-isoprenylcysteine O-methyltransferase Ste14
MINEHEYSFNSVQAKKTKSRLLVSRAFGLSALIFLGLGASYWSSRPLLNQSLFSSGVLLAVLGVCGRLWCFSYIAGRKKRVLVTIGPYSLCRHPLYFFSLIGGIGLGLCTETLSAPLLFALAFAAYYPHIIQTEEKFLRNNFQDYEVYREAVPLFFPKWSNFSDGDLQINARDFQNEILGAGSFLLLIGVFEFLEAMHRTHLLPTYFLIP